MKNRLLACIFAICLVVSLIPVKVLAEDEETMELETENVIELIETTEELVDENLEVETTTSEESELVVEETTVVETLEENQLEEDADVEVLSEAAEEETTVEEDVEYLAFESNTEQVELCLLMESEEDNSEVMLSEEVEANGVAVIGEESYESLNQAILAAEDGILTEIKLVKNATGGIKVPAGKNIIIDLNGYEIDVIKAVGSTGTETNGLQLLKGSTIAIKNGLIKASVSSVKIMIKNYANLTIENVDIRGSVNNCGQLVVDGANTKIEASGWAVYTGNYAKGDVITTVINAGNISSVAIETPLWETGGATVNESVTSIINGGTIGRIGTYDWRKDYGGSYLNAPLLKNWKFVVNGGSIGINDFGARIGNSYYESLVEALDKAEAGNAIELLKDVDLGSDTLSLNKAVSIDGGNAKHSISGTATNVIRVLSTDGALAGTIKLANLAINATNASKSGRAIGIGSSNSITGLNLVIENCDIKTTQRGLTVNSNDNSNINLTIRNSTISLTNGIGNYDQEVNNTGNYNNSRGISLWQMGNSKVDIINTTVQGFYYSINNANGIDTMQVNVTNSTLKCRAGINDWTAGTTWNINGTRIHGINNFGGKQEAFANIVLNTDDNTVNITDSVFTTFFNETGKANEHALQSLVSDRGKGNVFNIGNNVTYQIYDLTKGGVDNDPTAVAKKYECVDAGLANGTYKILEHKVEAVAKKNPTCANDGYEAHYKCLSCGKIYSSAEGTDEFIIEAKSIVIPATGLHTPGDWTVELAATCTAKGVENRTCTNCGKLIETRSIIAKGHSYDTEGNCNVCGHHDETKVEVVAPIVEEPAVNAKPTEADASVVEVEAKEEVVEIIRNDVVVDEGQAEIKEEVIENIIEATDEGEAIVLPVSAIEEVNAVVLAENTMEAIAEKEVDVVIQLTDATIMLDSNAVAAILEQAEGKQIEIRAVISETEKLSDAQKSAIADKENTIVVTVQIYADGNYIGDFSGGKATVMLPLEIEEGQNAEDYKVYYVAEDGSLELVAAKYVDGHMVFTTGHFSDYVIVYEKMVPAGNEELTTPEAVVENSTSFPVIPVVIAVVLVGLIAIVMKKRQIA